jgi:hypothetical protein
VSQPGSETILALSSNLRQGMVARRLSDSVWAGKNVEVRPDPSDQYEAKINLKITVRQEHRANKFSCYGARATQGATGYSKANRRGTNERATWFYVPNKESDAVLRKLKIL